MMASSSPNQHWHWHRHWKSFIFFLTKKFMKNRPFMSNTLLYSFLNLSIRHQNLFATVTLLFTISYPGSTKLISKILESFKVNLQVFVGIIAAVQITYSVENLFSAWFSRKEIHSRGYLKRRKDGGCSLLTFNLPKRNFIKDHFETKKSLLGLEEKELFRKMKMFTQKYSTIIILSKCLGN